MLTHVNLLGPAEGFVQAEGLRPSDEHLSYLPMAWIGNSLFSLALHHAGRLYHQLPGKTRDAAARQSASSARPWRWRRRGCGRTC